MEKQIIMFVSKKNDDDRAVVDKLAEMGYEIITADFNADPSDVCSECRKKNVDVMVIDDAAGGLKGYDFLKVASQKCECGIIYASVNTDVMKEILALEIGADDFIKSPIHPGLLAVRIRNLLKRKDYKEIKKEEEIRYPGLIVNLSQYRVEVDGERIKMPPKELELLYLLASNPNIVYTREKLLDIIWGYDFDIGSRTVDVHVKRLRDKIEKDSNIWQIGTVWSVGYRFEFKDECPDTGTSEIL
ncbi:MAG: response regulator transcription factor [Clostridia bacterium]|nr:response regulator transcription factor [Clostridia bacterium]